MIQAQPGLMCAFGVKDTSRKHPTSLCLVGGFVKVQSDVRVEIRHRIVAWDDEGQPLVVGKRGLESPHQWDNFLGVVEATDAYQMQVVVEMIPATEWVVWTVESDGSVWTRRLVAWGRCGDGRIVPLGTDSNGDVDVENLSTDNTLLRSVSDEEPTAWIAHRRAALMPLMPSEMGAADSVIR